jgi:hypothetical protein
MKVCVYSEGDLVWSRETEHAAGRTAECYLRDGTQQKIIDALVGALAEARGQLGYVSLQIVDAVTDVRTIAAKIDGCIPIAIIGDRNAGR